MQGHEPGVTERKHPDRLWGNMITTTSNRPHFYCNDVVLTLGVGGPHFELVDELRRTAWRRFAEERQHRMTSWLRNFS